MKLLFFDIDGTIYWDGKVSEENIDAMKRVQSDGNLLILNTGRSYGFAPQNVLGCVDWDGVICGTGYVRMRDEVLHSAVLPLEALQEMYEYCIKNEITGYFEGETAMYMVCSTEQSVAEYEQRKRNVPDVRYIKLEPGMLEQIYDEMRITKTALGGKKDIVYPSGFYGVYVLPMYDYAEVYLNGYDKSTGMKIIGKKLGVDRKDMIAFGDSRNDRDMLKYAGVSAVMDHAPDDILASASVKMKSGPCGVAECLKQLFPQLF